MTPVRGIHHITAISGDAQENLDFYTQVLGLRLVKRSVNQDSPGTYHLFYADAEGRPGTDLTFFPWPDLPPARAGAGLAMEVGFAVPPGSLEYWAGRLRDAGVRTEDREERFGRPTLPFRDPHGLGLSLTEASRPLETAPWTGSPVAESRQIRGFHAVRLWERDGALAGNFLRGVLGFGESGEESGWKRYTVGDGGSSRIVEIRERPDGAPGAWGRGGVHHVAFRVSDDAEQGSVRRQVLSAGVPATAVIDRFWFRSVYFHEPGGVLFELATDGPGFHVDEPGERLGESLILPPWLEPQRRSIESALPTLTLKRNAAADATDARRA
jgi:glyoxalase family protein